MQGELNMSALSAARNTREVYCNASAIHRVKEVAASTTIYPGSICAVNASGKAVPASDTAGLIVIGRCEEVLTGGRIIAKSGVYVFDNGASTEALDATDINAKVYVVDDHTVGAVGGTNSIVAGVMRDILPDGGIVVEIGNQAL